VVPALLRGRVFRRYWGASAISMFGDRVSGVALPLAAVLALHAGATQMGYLTALEWQPTARRAARRAAGAAWRDCGPRCGWRRSAAWPGSRCCCPLPCRATGYPRWTVRREPDPLQ
jgi:hypothetical protein